MPGTLNSFEVIVFDDHTGELVQSDDLMRVGTADEACALAERLAASHAGTLALARSTNTAVGEVNPVRVLLQHGRIGDFA
ncbi:hypothetical protein LRX75_11860 [Rhizobium sp. DKSPLA3]|uniref:Uncharacterized protein n=1 Tax=Rhizobium quercicola TaxID=2901226 RepID=A0A9X1NRM2_9HYPH|nr:hypothetical protein [Rhizobium quercicola]MCD7109732.1 hypothetical protein [Rhizobium quercicola]